MKTKKIILFVFCLFVAATAYSHEFTIVYTANTDSSLYPCGACPASVGGGLTRRAAILKDILADKKNVVVVDGGNFLPAKAVLDRRELSDELSKQKVTFYLGAMKKMGYDVIGIGKQDFGLGEKFLENAIIKSGLKFVSNDTKIKGASPYYIKNFPGFKVAFIGLTPLKSFDAESYVSDLKDIYNRLGRKVDFIVLISSLGDEQNMKLAKSLPEIELILSSGPVDKLRKSEAVDNTVIITPTPQGKNLNVVDISFEKGKIKDWSVDTEGLPLITKEDTEIKRSIPVCFSSKDCRKMGKMISRCDKPGTLDSLCVYYDAKSLEATIITDEKYPFCSVELPKKDLAQRFLGLELTTLDYNDTQAKKLIREYDIDTLPAFIFPQDIKEERGFGEISDLLTEKKDVFLAKPALSGICLFLDRKPRPNHIDLFFAFDEINTDKVLIDLAEFSQQNKIDLDIHLVMPQQNDVKSSKEETELALAVKKLYPDKFIDYLIMRFNNQKSLYWLKQMQSLGIDPKRVEYFIESGKMEKLLEKNNAVISDFNVLSGNVIVINNNRIFRVFKVDAAGLKEFFDISKVK